MDRKDAGRVVEGMAEAVFAFVFRRCASHADAEDLSQEILFRAFRALLKTDPEDAERYVWRIARNALSNYYRGKARHGVGIPLEEIAESLPDPEDPFEDDEAEETTLVRLRGEIARLSALRRKIVVLYYFDHRSTPEIEKELGIPAGTVKWHLFEARKELKKGMETMRKTEQLNFNPIRFTYCGTNGSVGTMGGNQNFFRSILCQNIAYTVYREAKTAGEIAANLGVSPVYVEAEADYLEEYGFLTRKNGRYLANMLINEPSEEECALREAMYEKSAALLGDRLFDALKESGLPDDRERLWGGLCGEMTMTEDPPRDRNLLLWALFPYIAAVSGEAMQERGSTVSFEEAAVIRPDGGHNICEARIDPPGYPILPADWNGPCWNQTDGLTIWQVDSPWSGRRVTENHAAESALDCRLLLSLDMGGELREDEYARLCERGFITVVRRGGMIRTGFRCAWIRGREMKRRLLSVGDRIREECHKELDALRKPYIEAVMAGTPERLRKMQAFGLGYLFYSDGAFLYHCLRRMTDTGRLIPPPESLRRSLSLLVIDEREE